MNISETITLTNRYFSERFLTGKKKKFSFFLWHRRLGLIALALMLILAITGIALNHTESLKLDKQIVESDLIIDWYGLNPKSDPVSYQIKNNIVTQWDKQLFFNTRIVYQTDQLLRGAVIFNNMTVIALDETILLLNKDGDLVEEIIMDFSNITAITTDIYHVYLKDNQNKIYMSDKDIISWNIVNQSELNWNTPSKLDNKLKLEIKESYRGQGITLERVILDLHSGRIFNQTWGIYLMDASAVIMIWLGLSGSWIWFSRNRKMKSKHHYQKRHR